MSSAGADADRLHNDLIRVLLAEGKLDAAQKDADAWVAAAPNDVWAVISQFEVGWREGQVLEALPHITAAAQLDGCNARVHADYAQMLRFSGMNAMAAQQAELARRLDPVDDDIAGLWLELKPRSQQLPALNAYLKQASYLTDEQRKSVLEWKGELSEPNQSSCRLVGEPQSVSMAMSRRQFGISPATEDGLYVSLDGKVRDLAIDTGAHGLLLSKSAARSLHLPAAEKGNVSGLGDEGDVPAHGAVVKDVKIGSVEFQNCPIEVLDKWDEALDGRDGLIGMDIFSDFLITLDFPGKVLKLAPLPALPATNAVNAVDGRDVLHDRYVAPAMANWTRAFRGQHDLVLPVRVNGGAYRLFVMDTGGSENLISWELAKQYTKVHKDRLDDYVGLSGEVKHVYRTDEITLTFGGHSQKVIEMGAMDRSEFATVGGAQMDGIIGAYTLHQATVQIDYRDDLVNFILEPSRLKHCSVARFDSLSDCYPDGTF